MYCEPVLCVVSLLGNIAILLGMTRVKHGFSSNVRFYYSMIAIAELVVVGCYYLVGDFLETRIAYLVSGGAFYPILTYNATYWSCKFLNALWRGPEYLCGWTFICLGVESVIAVTLPLRAKRLLSSHSALQCVIGNHCEFVGTRGFPPTLLYRLQNWPAIRPLVRLFAAVHSVLHYAGGNNSTSQFFISLGISIYLVVTVARSMLIRSHISSGCCISAREVWALRRLCCLMWHTSSCIFQMAYFYWMYSFTVVNPSAFDNGL